VIIGCCWFKIEIKDEDDGLVELVNQYMVPLVPEFETVSADNQYECNDWANSHKHSNLSIDESEIRKKFKDKS